MNNTVDISEDYIRDYDKEVLELLLYDRTIGNNIYWASDVYKEQGRLCSSQN